ncbi:Phosphoenolpyruvate/phosphate translocator 2, chloroplastic [Glycine soja]
MVMVVSSLVPIVGRVAWASMTEVSFNWIGFTTTMASNHTNQSWNETLDNINLYLVITIISFLLLVPCVILVEGVKFSPSYLQFVLYALCHNFSLVYPFLATIIAFQFGFASLVINLVWTLNLHPRPNISGSHLATILPPAVAHTMGNLLTNISLGKVAVSFTHTIKVMEPFFTVVLSTLLLGDRGQIIIPDFC